MRIPKKTFFWILWFLILPVPGFGASFSLSGLDKKIFPIKNTLDSIWNEFHWVQRDLVPSDKQFGLITQIKYLTEMLQMEVEKIYQVVRTHQLISKMENQKKSISYIRSTFLKQPVFRNYKERLSVHKKAITGKKTLGLIGKLESNYANLVNLMKSEGLLPDWPKHHHIPIQKGRATHHPDRAH